MSSVVARWSPSRLGNRVQLETRTQGAMSVTWTVGIDPPRASNETLGPVLIRGVCNHVILPCPAGTDDGGAASEGWILLEHIRRWFSTALAAVYLRYAEWQDRGRPLRLHLEARDTGRGTGERCWARYARNFLRITKRASDSLGSVLTWPIYGSGTPVGVLTYMWFREQRTARRESLIRELTTPLTRVLRVREFTLCVPWHFS